MKLLLWGVSNVGKTTIGKELSKRLNYRFYDIDEELIKSYGSIDTFQLFYPFSYDRYAIKEDIMKKIILSDDDFVLAVSPIFSIPIVNNILNLDTEMISLEITDTPEAIFDRLIIDGDDAYEYKMRHKQAYLKEIRYDQTASYEEFKKIPKINITNKGIKEAADYIYEYLIQIKAV